MLVSEKSFALMVSGAAALELEPEVEPEPESDFLLLLPHAASPMASAATAMRMRSRRCMPLIRTRIVKSSADFVPFHGSDRPARYWPQGQYRFAIAARRDDHAADVRRPPMRSNGRTTTTGDHVRNTRRNVKAVVLLAMVAAALAASNLSAA